jgi:hypothetical protein
MKMFKRCIAFMPVLLATCASSPKGVPDGAVFTELGEVVVEGDLDQPFPDALRLGHGGGMNVETMFSKFHFGKLKRCQDEIRRVAIAWAAEQKLSLVTERRDAHHLLLHFASAEPRGFYEVTYKIYPEHRSTHAYFGFYDAKLTRLAPETIKALLDRNALGPFSDRLRKAAACEDGGTL